MEIRHLEVFQAVAETGSFTAAAKRLGYAQSSISVNILAIEREFHIQLFHRIGRRIQLTPEGQQLLPHARQILQSMKAARASLANDQPQGSLVIGAAESSGTYHLPPIVEFLYHHYPAIQVQVIMDVSADYPRALREGRLDAVLMLDEPNRFRDMISTDVHEEEIHLICSPDHPLAQQTSLDPASLAAYPYLATPVGSYRARFEAYLASINVTLRSTIELGSIALITECIQANLGYGVLPIMAVEKDVAKGNLVTHPLPRTWFTMPTQLIRHVDHWVSPALQVFWDQAVALCRGTTR